MNVTFDANEWFFILASVVVLCLFLLIRSYFSPAMLMLLWVYNLELVGTIDYFLIASPFRLYFFGDNTSYELSGALFHFFMYPCASVIFLFIYDKWKLNGMRTVWYIACWTVFALCFEWFSVINHALVYSGWKLYYSIPFYPAAALLLIALYRFAQKKLEQLSLPKLTK